HIWGDDGTGCSGDDFVPDTPNQGGPNYGTPPFPTISCGNGPAGDMFMNYMDYVDDAAMVRFSAGQVPRMQAARASSRASNGVSVPCGKSIPKEITKEFPKDPPKELAKEHPKDLAKDAPKDFPKELHKEFPKDPPKELIKEHPKDLTKDAPKDFPKELSKEF